MDRKAEYKILEDLIAIDTVGKNEKDIAVYLQKLFSEHGIESQIDELEGENRANLVAEISGTEAGKTLVYSGHADVVSAGEVSDWKHDPFKLTEDGDKLYGRGTTDMKAGLAAMAISLIELKESGAPFKGKLRFLMTAGEESEMPGSQDANAKGHLKDADALVVGEPSQGLLVPAHKGSLQYKITVTGESAHSSLPGVGINALDALREVMNLLEPAIEKAAAENEDEVLGQTFNVFTRLDAGDQINTVPAHAVLYANARTSSGLDNEATLEVIQQVISEVEEHSKAKFELEVIENAEPVSRPTDSDIIKAAQAINSRSDYQEKWVGALREAYDKSENKDPEQEKQLSALEKDPHIIGTGEGVTDASFLLKDNQDASFIIFGPGIASKAHVKNEFIFTEDYYAYCEKYVELAKEYLK